jgi:copper(I)-binding protein
MKRLANMIPVRFFAIALLSLLLPASVALAEDYKLGDLEIGQPWSRATPPTAPTAGGFLTVTNKGTMPDIPAGATVTLAPGGYHLMLVGLKAPFKAGTRVPVTLVFEKAGSIDVEMDVQAMGSTAPAHGR